MNYSMKHRFQISIFLLIVIILVVITRDFWENWFIGMFFLVFSVIGMAISVVIFLENRQPSKTITWLVVMAFNPVIGTIFYMLFGQSYRKKKLFAAKAERDELALFEYQERSTSSPSSFVNEGEHRLLLSRLSQRLGRTPVSVHTDTQVLTNGEETFSRLIEELQNAKHHIHIQYYIFRNDELGNTILNLLKNKAKAGVEVRFLYDAVGCWDFTDTFIDELQLSGIQAVSFLPVVFPLFSNKVNFRNHRKIVVIDGEVGFVGGLNIGDEYLGKDPYYGFWRDTHLWVKGEAVRSLQFIFLQDWFHMTEERLSDPPYFPADLPQYEGSGAVQMVAGGPDHQWEVIKHLFFSMIVSAKRSIWIASPYFIPDEDILGALKVACLSGIDVRLLVPSKPDKRIVFYASRSYFPELLEAGMQIYTYQKGFMHSKVIIVDGELASIGTSNMDMRSFHLNFEVNCFLYNTPSVRKLATDYEDDLRNTEQIDPEAFAKRPLRQRIAESLARLASPLL